MPFCKHNKSGQTKCFMRLRDISSHRWALERSSWKKRFLMKPTSLNIAIKSSLTQHQTDSFDSTETFFAKTFTRQALHRNINTCLQRCFVCPLWGGGGGRTSPVWHRYSQHWLKQPLPVGLSSCLTTRYRRQVRFNTTKWTFFKLLVFFRWTHFCRE